MPKPEETSTNRHYPLSALIQDVRADAPQGRTFAVKRVVFPPRLPELKSVFPHGRLATLRVLRAAPEEYVVAADKLAGGLAIANFALITEECDPVRVRRSTPEAVVEGENGAGRDVSANLFRGRLMLPEVISAEVIGAFVPNETSTGFVHVLDPDKLPALEDVFENGMRRESGEPPVPIEGDA